MSKHVVILEFPNGYIDCIAIEEDEDKAFGKAFKALYADIDTDDCYITIPDNTEGENGIIIYCKNRVTGELISYCTILYFDE